MLLQTSFSDKKRDKANFRNQLAGIKQVFVIPFSFISWLVVCCLQPQKPSFNLHEKLMLIAYP